MVWQHWNAPLACHARLAAGAITSAVHDEVRGVVGNQIATVYTAQPMHYITNLLALVAMKSCGVYKKMHAVVLLVDRL